MEQYDWCCYRASQSPPSAPLLLPRMKLASGPTQLLDRAAHSRLLFVCQRCSGQRRPRNTERSRFSFSSLLHFGMNTGLLEDVKPRLRTDKVFPKVLACLVFRSARRDRTRRRAFPITKLSDSPVQPHRHVVIHFAILSHELCQRASNQGSVNYENEDKISVIMQTFEKREVVACRGVNVDCSR